MARRPGAWRPGSGSCWPRAADLLSRGFSLAEIILVIAVGTVLLWSGTMMYLNARESAGLSRARDKVFALQQVVEQMASNAGGEYPGIYQVAQVWHEKRKDAASSPWGGKIGHGYSKASDPVTYYGITGPETDLATGDYPRNDPLYDAPTGTGSVPGLLEYRRIANAGVASFFDFSINASRSFRAYAVNIRDTKSKTILFTGAAPPP